MIESLSDWIENIVFIGSRVCFNLLPKPRKFKRSSFHGNDLPLFQRLILTFFKADIFR